MKWNINQMRIMHYLLRKERYRSAASYEEGYRQNLFVMEHAIEQAIDDAEGMLINAELQERQAEVIKEC